jgi:hypothetical protein
MSQVEKTAAKVRRAAEREHTGRTTREQQQRNDSDSALAHPILTDPKLRKGHPPSKRNETIGRDRASSA